MGPNPGEVCADAPKKDMYSQDSAEKELKRLALLKKGDCSFLLAGKLCLVSTGHGEFWITG